MSDVNADVLIVGSGVAGALTAYKLAQQGVSVTVLEAGPRIQRADVVEGFKSTHKLDASGGFPNPDHAPRPDWTENDEGYFDFTGKNVAKTEYLKVVGGTTWHWTGICPRFLANDFRLKSKFGIGVDWPFDLDEMRPYYEQAERELGVAGDSGQHNNQDFPLPAYPLSYSDKIVKKELARIGVHMISHPVARNTRAYQGQPQCVGFGSCSPICPSGAQYAGIRHVEKAESMGVKVLANTRVDKLLCDRSGHIQSVLAQQADGTSIVARGRVVVVAANGIESPRLLLMSACDEYPNGLANRSGAVGRHYMDHVATELAIQVPFDAYPGRGPLSLLADYQDRDGDFRGERPAGIFTAYMHSKLDLIAAQLLEKRKAPPEIDLILRDRMAKTLDIGISMEQLPSWDNRMSLNWSRLDRAGQPRMQFDYQFGDYSERGVQHAEARLHHYADKLRADVVGHNSAHTFFHPMGMTRMGDDPNESVVDANGRAHDHHNLYVVSSAVFPTGGTGNPTITIAALAIRTAGKIHQQLLNDVR